MSDIAEAGQRARETARLREQARIDALLRCLEACARQKRTVRIVLPHPEPPLWCTVIAVRPIGALHVDTGETVIVGHEVDVIDRAKAFEGPERTIGAGSILGVEFG